MNKPLTYYADAYDPFAQRAIILLHEKQQRIELRSMQELPAQHRRFNLSGHQPPVLVAGDTPIQLMMLVCEYLDETMGTFTLHPKDPTQRAIHSYYCEIGTWLLNTMGEMHRAGHHDQLQAKAAAIRTMLGVMEEGLGSGPYFAGDTFSFVDIWFGPMGPYFDIYQQHTALGFLDNRPRLGKYFAALASRESVARAIPPDAKAHILEVMKRRDSEFSRMIDA